MAQLPSKYRVERTLGTGSSGTVFLALDQQLDRQVAIKELSPALVMEPTFLEQFREEARTMARLDNDHCVRVFEFIEQPGRAWLVSEFVDGASLRAIIDKAGPLTPEQSLGVVKGALQGLSAAHALGLVHRDVKPENMLSDREGVSKLADFGQAVPRSLGPGAAGGMTGGTAAYMSPEQAAGGPVDHRSDLYSAGIVLFELLTGRVPFTGDNALAVMRSHINQAVPDARTFKPDLPEPVAAMLRHATAHGPDERPQTAEQLLAEVETAAVAAYGADWEERSSHKKLVLAALAALGLLGAATAGAAAAGTTGEAVLGAGGGVPVAAIAGGVLAAVVLIGGGYFALRGNLLGQHSNSGVAVSSPSSSDGSPSPQPGPSPASSATPSTAPGPSPSAAAPPGASPPAGTPPGTNTPRGAPPITSPRNPPSPVPSPSHTFIITAAPGSSGSMQVSSARVYFQQCTSNGTPPPGQTVPVADNCGFVSDGSPYYDQANAYPGGGSGFDCSPSGAWKVMEQYDFANTYNQDIPVTVNWNIVWADGSKYAAAPVSQVIRSGTGGTHAADPSGGQVQPPYNPPPSSNGSAFGNARYTLTWTDPAGKHFLNSEQPVYWGCGRQSLG